MRKLLILICVVALSSGDRMGAYQDVKKKFDKFNLFAQCFGNRAVTEHYKHVEEANAYCAEHAEVDDSLNAIDSFTDEELDSLKSLVDSPAMGKFNRQKRNAAAVESFKAQVDDHRAEMKSKMTRMGCVLKKMEMVDEDGEIKVWDYDLLKLIVGKTPAGSDDDFVRKLADMYSDCNDIAAAWPQKMLDRHPLTKLYGRKKIYFECMVKGEMELCYKYQMYEALKMQFQIDIGTTNLGFHGDKFEQAKSAWLLAFEQRDEEYKFVNDFFWSQNRD